MEIQSGIPVLPARPERKVSALEAAKLARGGNGEIRSYRIGLKPLHPNFSATYGQLCFHKISEKVSNGGYNRVPVRGQIVALDPMRLQAALEDARYKMVRTIGGFNDPARTEEYDVRRVAVGAVSKSDLPVLYYEGPLDQPVDIAKIDWAKSLIYIEADPVADEAPPPDFEAAIRKMHENIEKSFSLGIDAPPPAGKAAAADPAVAEAMKRAKGAGLKVAPGGEVRS